MSIITTTESLSVYLMTQSLFLRRLFSVTFSSIVIFSHRSFGSSISFVKLLMHSNKSGSVLLSARIQFDLDANGFCGLLKLLLS